MASSIFYDPSSVVPVVTLFTSTTAAGNVNTGETVLIAYPLPANTLSVNGNKVRITAWGTFANNANQKTFRLYFGASTQIVNRVNVTDANVAWKVSVLVVRTGATSQIAISDGGWSGTNNIGVFSTAPAETLSGPVTIQLTGTSATASNDVTALGMIVEWLP